LSIAGGGKKKGKETLKKRKGSFFGKVQSSPGSGTRENPDRTKTSSLHKHQEQIKCGPKEIKTSEAGGKNTKNLKEYIDKKGTAERKDLFSKRKGLGNLTQTANGKREDFLTKANLPEHAN